MIMDLNQFLNEFRLFRQKLGEEIGVKDDELALKFFMAFKRLSRLNKSPFKTFMDDYFNTTSHYNPYKTGKYDEDDSDKDNYFTP